MRELVARVHALLRRVDARPSWPPPHGPTSRRSATSRSTAPSGGSAAPASEVHLTPTEFDLLVYLADRPRAVLTREQLLAEVWGWADASGTRTVDSHVKALRRKLGADRDPHRARRRLRPGGAAS